MSSFSEMRRILIDFFFLYHGKTTTTTNHIFVSFVSNNEFSFMHLIFSDVYHVSYPPSKNKQTKFDHQLLPKIHNNHHLFMKIIRILLAVQQHQRLPSCCARKNLNSRRWWWRWIRINRRKTSEPFYSISRVFFFSVFRENMFLLFTLVVFFFCFSLIHTWWSRTRHGRPQRVVLVMFLSTPQNGTHSRHAATLFSTLKFRI